MSFQQGLSGLNAASKSLEVIGNNVANASTVGFKQSQTVFADVYANSLTGGGASQIGIGTKLTKVAQQFTQGNLSATNNPLDISINGNGFFRLQNATGGDFYSRNGQFQLNNEGFIVSPTGLYLTGYPAGADGQININVPQPEPLQIPFGLAAAKATNAVTLGMNLNASESVKGIPFNRNDPESYNHTTSVSVYDSLGDAHILQTYYVKTDAGEWDVYGVLDGNPLNYTAGTPEVHSPIASLTFGPTGTLTATDLTGWEAATPIALPAPYDAAAPLDFTLGFNNSTQYSGGFSVSELKQDGYAAGTLASFSVGSDGVILGRYTNGVSLQLGQVALASFNNPNGLQMSGNNVWQPTAESGEVIINRPGMGNTGLLQASSVEESNVDLTAELVKMITAQRNYQANAQTIKTQDQAMQTLVNLR
jgi:flagellar hook protein FlgE